MSEDPEIEEIKRRKLENLMKTIASRKRPLSDTPIDIDTSTFSESIKANRFVVVDCWAPWCGPCKLLSPIIEDLAKKYAGKFLFAKLNVDDSPEIASKFGINAIPTLLFFVDGKLIHREIGALPKEHIESILGAILQKYGR